MVPVNSRRLTPRARTRSRLTAAAVCTATGVVVWASTTGVSLAAMAAR